MDDAFVGLFGTHFPRLYRYLDRVSGKPDLASDIAQETFLRLYRRGTPPDAPAAWLISEAMKLLRRRGRSRAGDPPPSSEDAALADGARLRVRRAIDCLPDRERSLLLLHAEGYAYRDIAIALELNEHSIGPLLAGARHAFRVCYERSPDAP